MKPDADAEALNREAQHPEGKQQPGHGRPGPGATRVGHGDAEPAADG